MGGLSTPGVPVPGTILGERYVLLAALGEAPGYVEFRARDQELETEVALWWIRPELFADPSRRDALLGAGVELRALADPSLRTCYGVGRGTGGVWATWQLATGAGPAPRTDGEPVPLGDLRRWFDAAARALATLHAHGLVHGRMTAHDVVSVGGVLKLGGGGLWRDVDPVAALRAWPEAYVAPEMRRHAAAAEAADTWSLAMIALAMIAGTPDDPGRAAARRHPQLAAVLVGAMSPDPGRRPAIGDLLAAVRNAAEAPYLDAAKGKGVPRGGEAATQLGHASGKYDKAAVAPKPSLPTPVTVPPPPPRVKRPSAPAISRPRPLAAPKDTQPGLPPKPGAFSPQPETFALPTPSAAPPAPRPTKPVVVPPSPSSRPPSLPASQPPLPPAIAGAIERARTAPPGEFRLAAVSMKDQTGPQPAIPDQPTGETPALVKPRLRAISEVQGGRTFSVAPGQMGYLAPPKAVTDAKNKSRRNLVILAVIVVLALVGGIAAAVLL